MNKKLFLLPFLTFSLALAGCSIHGEEPEDEPKAKEIWEEDLVEGESTFDQVKAGTPGQYYKVRGTVAANSGSTLALYRGGKFLYCYNFNSDQDNNGGQTKLEEHKLGSYVEIYAQSSAYSDSIQLTAYDVGETKTSKKYDEAASLTKLADKGETVTPIAASTAEDFGNAKAAGALLKVNFVAGKDYTFNAANTSDNQDLNGKVGEVDVTLRVEKYLPADVREALLDDAHKSFVLGATYDLVALAAATSSGSCRLVAVEGSSWTKTTDPQWAAPTSVLIEAEGDKNEIEVNQQLQLDFTVMPNTAKPAVTWSSSDETVATVNDEGIVKGLAIGEVDIFALAANSETVKGTYHINVIAPSKTITQIDTPVAGTKYKAGINHTSLEAKYFLNGEMNSFRAATSNDTDDAVDFELVAIEGQTNKYNLKVYIDETTVKYVNIKADGGNVNFLYEATAETAFEYNSTFKTITCEVTGCTTESKNGTNYIGSYGATQQHLSVSALTYLKEDMSNYETAGGQYPLHFYTVA